MSRSGFSSGDTVFIKSLKKTAIVLETLRNDSYRVAVGSLSMVVHHSDLEPGQRKTEGGHKAVSFPKPPRHSRVSTILDLHGLTVDEAVRKLESYLNDCIIAGHGAVKIVHGLGTGKLQHATHETLKRYSAVRAFRVNDLNPGETDVYIG